MKPQDMTQDMTRYLANGRDVWKSGFMIVHFTGAPGVAGAMAQEYADWQNSKLPPERYYVEKSAGADWQVNIRFGPGDFAARAVDLTEAQAIAVAKLLNEARQLDHS